MLPPVILLPIKTAGRGTTMTKEFLSLNRRPINQAAKKAMGLLEFRVELNYLYVLQLAIEEMEARRNGVWTPHEDIVLEEFLVKLLGVKPERVWWHFIREMNGRLRMYKKEAAQFLRESETDPEDFAAEIVAAFEDWRMVLRDQE